MKKEFVILSFSYDEKNQRIGCILKNIGLFFCEASDNFETEKVIEGIIADKIVYLNAHSSWVTIHHNSLNFWQLY